MPLSQEQKMKLAMAGSACIAILALIAALLLYQQNSVQAASIMRLQSEKAVLQTQNQQLEKDLQDAKSQAGNCQNISQLLSILTQYGGAGGLTPTISGLPGLTGGALPDLSGLSGNLTGGALPGLTPEMMQAIMQAVQNASASNN